MIIEEQLYQYSQECPDKIALISGDVTVTYSQLWNGMVKHPF
jgi:hypothetical protein